MDLGPDPIDHDDIVQRYGRRLFVLAYHLTGDSAQGEELCQESLVRGLLAPDFPAVEKEAGIYLHRGLISLWRERTAARGRGPRPIGDARPGGPPARPPRDHAALWQALARLDAVSRAVLVLRVAEGLEYETIGKVLEMAPDIVYARLLAARGGLREGERNLDAPTFETMNLYLDARLAPDQRGAFESRLKNDAGLRERVEFHRGLALELHEEAPPLPRDFLHRLRDRMQKARETLAMLDEAAEEAGWDPAPEPQAAGRGGGRGADRGGSVGEESWERGFASGAIRERRSQSWLGFGIAAFALLICGVALGIWISGHRPVAPQAGGAGDGAAAAPGGTPDEATVEALRSLGYLAPAKDGSKKAPADPVRRPAATPKPAAAVPSPAKKPAASPPSAKGSKPPAAPPAIPSRAESPAAASPSATPESSAAPPSESQPAVTPPPAVENAAVAPPPVPETPAGETAVAWRVVPLVKPLDAARDRQTIRSAPEWTALFDEAGGPPPAVDFEKEMAALLRADGPADPPTRLVVAGVKTSAGAVLIECRREPAGPDAPPGDVAVVVPLSDLPIRFLVQQPR